MAYGLGNYDRILSWSEAKNLGFVRYFTGKPCKRGHVSERFSSTGNCAQCLADTRRRDRAENPDRYRQYSRKSSRQKRANNPERIRELDRARYAANAEKMRERQRTARAENSDRYRELSRRRYAANPQAWRQYFTANREKVRERMRKWHEKNPERRRTYQAARRAALLNATPAWADLSAIAEFYANCQAGMQVDHEIPLKGKYVCGLHVADNLRYLSPSENFSKRNLFVYWWIDVQ